MKYVDWEAGSKDDPEGAVYPVVKKLGWSAGFATAVQSPVHADTVLVFTIPYYTPVALSSKTEFTRGEIEEIRAQKDPEATTYTSSPVLAIINTEDGAPRGKHETIGGYLVRRHRAFTQADALCRSLGTQWTAKDIAELVAFRDELKKELGL